MDQDTIPLIFFFIDMVVVTVSRDKSETGK